jgi:hypothetical protein
MKRFLLILFAGALASGAAERITGGNGTLYIGGRPNRILVIDEATEKIVGEIRTRTGTPLGLDLSPDRKRFYMLNPMFEEVEVADIASRQIIDNFHLSEGNKKVRIRNMESDPTNRYLVMLTKTTTKLPDRFEIGPNTLQLYDMKEHKVARTIPWPKGEEREFAGMMFSPDGKFLYLFGDDIIVFDTKDYKEVDKWELSKPYEDGLGRINLNALDNLNEEPGFFTGIFTVQDPVTHRRIMGVARIDMPRKNIEFYPLGPATGVSFALAPGRKWAYGLHSEIGRYEFWSFDLENRKLRDRVEFPGRPRMSIRPSSNGKVLYIFTAGNTIDLYDSTTYKYMRTITLDTDMTTSLYVMPPR